MVADCPAYLQNKDYTDDQEMNRSRATPEYHYVPPQDLQVYYCTCSQRFVTVRMTRINADLCYCLKCAINYFIIGIQFSSSPSPYQDPKSVANMDEYIKMHSTPLRSVCPGQQSYVATPVPPVNQGSARRNSEPDIKMIKSIVFADFPPGINITRSGHSVENIYERIQ